MGWYIPGSERSISLVAPTVSANPADPIFTPLEFNIVEGLTSQYKSWY